MTEGGFGGIAAALDAPLVVVTAAEGAQCAGCLAGFRTQASVQPPRYRVWLSTAKRPVPPTQRAAAGQGR